MASDSQFRKLVSRNQDIAKLVEKGYAVTFDSGWMILRDIPYLDQHRELHWGAIATKLVPVDGAGLVTQERQGRHLIYRAAFDAMQELLAYLTENCCRGDVCITPDALACDC